MVETIEWPSFDGSKLRFAHHYWARSFSISPTARKKSMTNQCLSASGHLGFKDNDLPRNKPLLFLDCGSSCVGRRAPVNQSIINHWSSCARQKNVRWRPDEKNLSGSSKIARRFRVL